LTLVILIMLPVLWVAASYHRHVALWQSMFGGIALVTWKLLPHIIGMLLYDFRLSNFVIFLYKLLPHIIGLLLYDFRTRPSANEPKWSCCLISLAWCSMTVIINHRKFSMLKLPPHIIGLLLCDLIAFCREFKDTKLLPHIIGMLLYDFSISKHVGE